MKHIRSRFSGTKWRDPWTILVTAVFMLAYAAGLHYFRYLLSGESGRSSKPPELFDASFLKTPYPVDSLQEREVHHQRHLLADIPVADSDDFTTVLSPAQNESKNVTKDPLFPKDLFTLQQRRNGAIVLHVLGVIYMFVALAIVCDEFFVPSLDVIIEKLAIADDVAGATFMAAGGSAPELFTSVIGVFVSFDDVGIGTIVGSAVFNILFVIGMCALFSKTVLSLTWWPLFRDCTFYSISLLVLIAFFTDSLIKWWEALLLLGIYASYVIFMKFNQQVERAVKRHLNKNKHGAATSSSQSSVNVGPGIPGVAMGILPGIQPHHGPQPMLHSGTKFRHGLLQLMIHSIDPMHDGTCGKVDEKATQLHAIASLKVLLDATKPQNGAVKNRLGLVPTTPPPHLTTVEGAAAESAATVVATPLPRQVSGRSSQETDLSQLEAGNGRTSFNSAPGQPNGALPPEIAAAEMLEEAEDEGSEPLDISWPDTCTKRITYVLVAPIIFPLWITLPDPRSKRGKMFFPIAFLGSILWIAAFSYLMVWWANVIGDTAEIPPEVMGLTFLAAGTSIPDLITSVIVARKGLGDMAVSSSVGSNIFDVTVGLPLPWFLYGVIWGTPVEVNSKGMVCSIVILFLMLLFVILSIMASHWRMNKGLGVFMFFLYFGFVAVSLSFEYKYVTCPL